MSETIIFALWLTILVCCFVMYHKLFRVVYFGNVFNAILREVIICSVVSIIILALAVSKWWLVDIVLAIALLLFIGNKKYLPAVLCLLLIIMIAILGINGNKATEQSDMEEQSIVNDVENNYQDNNYNENNNFVNEDLEEDWIIPTDTSYAWDIYYGEEIISFLNNEIMCWHANSNTVNNLDGILDELEENTESFEAQYTLVDMDGDTRPEVVLSLVGNLDQYYMIIHYNDQSNDYPIYVKTGELRSMPILRVNGVYSVTIGTEDYAYYLYNFEPNTNCYEIELAKAEGGKFYIQSIEVSEEEFNDYYMSALETDLVEWKSFSDIELAEDLGVDISNDETDANGEFIFENSDKYLLDWSELEGLTAEECKIARNEIYARHGRMFSDEYLQAYFNSCSWYEGYISGEDFNEDVLSDIEKANRDLILEYEEEKGYR